MSKPSMKPPKGEKPAKDDPPPKDDALWMKRAL